MKNSLKIFILALVIILLLSLGILLAGKGLSWDTSVSDTDAVPEAISSPDSGDSADSALSFSTADLEGNPVDESIFQGKKLIMLNFWEPWCGPCVGEMPDLQKISEEYADKDFLIVGVYSTADGTAEVVDKLGISYPIIQYCDAFEKFMTGYVPTTVFLDGDGKVLTEPVVGSKSYDAWKSLIDSLLQ